MTPQQLNAVRAIARDIVMAVRATGDLGTPAGVLQSVLVSAGYTYEHCSSLVGALLRAGRLERRGNLLFAAVRPH